MSRREYPIRSTARKFRDSDGNLCTLLQLIKKEPEWAMNRIYALEEMEDKLLEVLKLAKQQIQDMEKQMSQEPEFICFRNGSKIVFEGDEIEKMRGQEFDAVVILENETSEEKDINQ